MPRSKSERAAKLGRVVLITCALLLAVFILATRTVFGQSNSASGDPPAAGTDDGESPFGDLPKFDDDNPFDQPFEEWDEAQQTQFERLRNLAESALSADDLYARGMSELSNRKFRDSLRLLDKAVAREPSARNFIGRSRAFCGNCRWGEYSAAVKRGLDWLAGRQGPGGAWDLDHTRLERGLADDGPSGRQRATSLAVLCFLSAGQTRQEGNYTDVVSRGLAFLASQAEVVKSGVDARGPRGNMTDHALATLVICEEFSLTGDKQLKDIAQRLLDFSVNAQNLESGGWGPEPHGASDVTTTGWAVLALASGSRAKLSVPVETFDRVGSYFDSLQTGEGAFYGASSPGKEPRATAIALMYRVLSGTPADDPSIQRGARYLNQFGLAKHDLEYNFFATCFLRHTPQDVWKTWNTRQRDHLMEQQVFGGSNSGSWFTPAQGDASSRSRLEQTALNTLCLEVYYRHLPVFHRDTRVGRAALKD